MIELNTRIGCFHLTSLWVILSSFNCRCEIRCEDFWGKWRGENKLTRTKTWSNFIYPTRGKLLLYSSIKGCTSKVTCILHTHFKKKFFFKENVPKGLTITKYRASCTYIIGHALRISGFQMIRFCSVTLSSNCFFQSSFWIVDHQQFLLQPKTVMQKDMMMAKHPSCGSVSVMALDPFHLQSPLVISLQCCCCCWILYRLAVMLIIKEIMYNNP